MHKLIDFYWKEEINTKEKELSSLDNDQDLAWKERQLAWMKETLLAVIITKNKER